MSRKNKQLTDFDKLKETTAAAKPLPTEKLEPPTLALPSEEPEGTSAGSPTGNTLTRPANDKPSTITGNSVTFPEGNSNAVQAPAVPEADKGGQAVEPQYQSDWSKGFFPALDTYKGRQIPIVQAISDYNKWATDTGNKPLDVMSTMAALQDRDPNKSIADNEEAERRARSNERWERIGNLLSHFGNFIGTTKGAPAQQLETGQALTARQKQLRDATIALRDKRNSAMMDAYLKDLAQKQTEKKEAQAYALALRKQEAEEKAAAIEMQLRVAKDQREVQKLLADLAKTQAEVNRIEELLPYEKRVKESTISRNYSSGNKNGGRNYGVEYKKQLAKDFAELREQYPDDFAAFERKYGLGVDNRGYGNTVRNWTEQLMLQFVAEQQRKRGTAGSASSTASSTETKKKKNPMS
jgi:hypothetical protein